MWDCGRKEIIVILQTIRILKKRSAHNPPCDELYVY